MHINYLVSKLSRQLLTITLLISAFVLISLGIVLPNLLTPIFEENLYNYLKEPLNFVNSSALTNHIDTEIAFIYVKNNKTAKSDNLTDIIDLEVNEILDMMPKKYGKFIYKSKYFYYYKNTDFDNQTRIALTNNKYINNMRDDILLSVIPITLFTCIIISLILTLWGRLLVKRIEDLKEKIDHIDDPDYKFVIDENQVDDEIKILDYAINDMRISIKKEEELRSQMYQNTSHDFKTPLTVIKSYIEAYNDNVLDAKSAMEVISTQTNKLDRKVHSLLELNKLDYMKETNVKLETIDLNKLIKESVEKFKYARTDLKYTLNLDKKCMFLGTTELWESIIDNMLGNFLRYAKSEVKITTRRNIVIFYNDGAKIEKDLKEGIFTPYRKGIKGEFGLGLSIIKKSCDLMKYQIEINNNLKTGVEFIIKKDTRNN